MPAHGSLAGHAYNPLMLTFRLSAALFIATALVGCSSTTGPSATVTALTIAGTASLSSVGQTSQLTLTAAVSSGAPQIVTSNATWLSSNIAVVTVSTAGLVTAQGYGGATISASYQGITTEFAFVVTIAGTWVANIPGGASVTWVLAQSQGIVSGTFSVAPIVAGNGLSAAAVLGTVSGSTFTWTMTGTISADSGNPQCVGTTPIITGIAQVQSGGASMNATIQVAMGVCDPNLTPSVPVGPAITFTKS
jgi:hypothetical protein